MADEFNGRQRALLAKLLYNAQSKTSSNSLISELQRQKEKFPKKTVIGTLQEIVKVDKIAETIYKELIKEFKTEISASECLRRFLTSYEEQVKYARKASTRQNIETINEDEEASVSKKIENVLQRNAELRTSASESKVNDSKVNDSRTSSSSANDSRASSNVNNSRASSNVNDSKRNNSGGKWWCTIVHLEWKNIFKWRLGIWEFIFLYQITLLLLLLLNSTLL